jgi:hypothetical protein
MRLLILIGLIISISSAQVFAETFECLFVWNWKDSIVVHKLIKKKYESFTNIVDRFSVSQATNLTMPVGKIGISSNGDRFCFQSFDLKKNLSKIFLLSSSAEKTAKILLNDRYNEFDPVFLGDNELIYCSDKTGMPKLWRLDLKTSKPVQITFKDSIDFKPDVFAADGTIVFNAIFPGTNKTVICSIDSRGTDFKYFCDGFMPKFSPDGKQIAFLKGAEKGTQIWITPSDAAKPTMLSEISGKIKSLCWAGGEKMVFTSDLLTAKMREKGITEANYNVYMIDIMSKILFQLTDNPSAQTEVVFSDSEKCIYFNSNRGNAWNIWKLKMKDVFDLPPPADIYVLPGDSAVVLSWALKDTEKASGYNVYFKPSRAKNWWKANDEIIKNLTYTVSDLKNTVAYDFKISSVDQSKMMESAFSEVVSARPEAASQSANDMKSALAIDASTGGLALNWQMPKSAPSFNVYYSLEPDKNFKKLNDSPVFGDKFNVNSKQIIAGNYYYFMVGMVGSDGGERSFSNTVSGKIFKQAVKAKISSKKSRPMYSERSAEAEVKMLPKRSIAVENNPANNIAVKTDNTPDKGPAATTATPSTAGDEWGDVATTDW